MGSPEILDVQSEPTGVADGVNVGQQRKRRVKADTKAFWPGQQEGQSCHLPRRTVEGTCLAGKKISSVLDKVCDAK